MAVLACRRDRWRWQCFRRPPFFIQDFGRSTVLHAWQCMPWQLLPDARRSTACRLTVGCGSHPRAPQERASETCAVIIRETINTDYPGWGWVVNTKWRTPACRPNISGLGHTDCPRARFKNFTFHGAVPLASAATFSRSSDTMRSEQQLQAFSSAIISSQCARNLQPHVVQAATVWHAGCNRMRWRL